MSLHFPSLTDQPHDFMFTLLRRLCATMLRAYRYGGLIEVVGCIKDGFTAVLQGFLGRMFRDSVPVEFWPSWSPELLAYRPYREGDWLVACGIDTKFTFDELFTHASNTFPSTVPLRCGAADCANRDVSTSSAFRRPSGVADEQNLQHHLRALYREQRIAVTRTANDDVWQIDLSDVPQRMTSIIIPTRERVDLLGTCIQSIQRYSKPGTYEIIVVDNGSIEAPSLAYLSELGASSVARVVRDAGSFNWSRLNNLGVAAAVGETFLFLNNDIEVLSDDWLARLSGFSHLHGVGCVGSMLVYDDRTVQHAGVVVGMGRWADHIYKFSDPSLGRSHTPFVPPSIVRPVLALTGACIAVSRENFNIVGGFDEGFGTIFGDTDFCLRLHRAGLRNIYLGDVQLLHYESKSRDPAVLPRSDFQRAFDRLEPYRTKETDPYFHPALSRFSLFPKLKSQGVDLSRWTRH